VWQTDIETLGDEIARLSAENRSLQQGLGIRSPASSSAASSVAVSPRDRRPSASDGEQAGEDEEEEEEI
jgi:hypothetical protein